MRYDYIMRFWDKFEEGGFKQMINRGAFCKNTNYDYLLTHSSSGYATIASGAMPSSHGIVSDIWFEHLANRQKVCTFDGKTGSLGSEKDNQRFSPRNMLSTAFADELKMSNFKQSKCYGISANNFGAIFPAGHLADGAFWMDKATGKWVSSTYYDTNLASWVSRFNRKNLQDIYLDKTWNTLFEANKYTQSLADDNSYEIGFPKGNKTFPYFIKDIKSDMESYDALMCSPFGNTFTKDLAVSVIVNEDLGKDKYCDFLSIGFVANGNVSNKFSIRSMELQDMYLQLDRDLASFLKFVDEFIGNENVLVYLTSDRGATDSPAFLKSVRMPGGNFKVKSAMRLLRSYLKALYGKGDWVQFYSGRQIYLNRNLIEDSKLSLKEVQQKTADFMVNFSGVGNAVTASSFSQTNFTSGIVAKAQNSFHQKRSGDVLLNLEPGWTENSSEANVEDSKISAYRDHTHVPLIWYGWKTKNTEVTSPISMTDIAPTLSNIMDVSYPNASTGKPILDIFEK